MGLSAIVPCQQDALQELGQGIAEGKLIEEMARLGKDFKFEGGESMNMVGERMNAWIQKTFPGAPRCRSEEYFVYTHGIAIKSLVSYVLRWGHQQTFETAVDNTSVSLITIQDGRYDVVYPNRNAQDM